MLPFVCSCWTALHRLDKEIPRFLRLWEIFRSAEKGIFPFGKALGPANKKRRMGNSTLGAFISKILWFGPAQFFQRHPLEFCPELLFHHGVEFPQRSVLGSGGDQPFRIFHTGEDVPQRDVFRAAGKGNPPAGPPVTWTKPASRSIAPKWRTYRGETPSSTASLEEDTGFFAPATQQSSRIA